MPTLLQDVLPVLVFCLGDVSYCCSYAVLIQQPICNVFDLPILVWALLLGLPGEWRQ